MTVLSFFPFSSQYITWEEWNGNLIHYFSEEPIPHNVEQDWKLTAEAVVQLPNFSPYALPDPELFPTWQEWADGFSQTLNGKVII